MQTTNITQASDITLDNYEKEEPNSQKQRHIYIT